ncbi:twin-arginine translocation signal domain-containing protein [Sphingomonas sediminicola]|uniref:Twin-arginine translocation signal domain-containing protein n=1 Tax=Sphingomonas sediminicola TaxID=386874 RepID=A0ABX6T9T4_9SPHN|nr:twin-arginine translocation signal domain-containing protein [Sphingomonas sediminicola]QNP46624.1 twin-arginine translocation signal domain-containing protein [Sphingomonas sediminicola]
MCSRCFELDRRSLLAGGGALAATMATGIAQARVRPPTWFR